MALWHLKVGLTEIGETEVGYSFGRERVPASAIRISGVSARAHVEWIVRRCGLLVRERVGVALAGEVGIGEGAIAEVGVDDVAHALAQLGAEDAMNAGVCQGDHS